MLRGLRFHAFSDSLQSCRPSSFRCSTRCDVSSSRAPRCIWKTSRSAISWPSSIVTSPAPSLHVGRSNLVGVLAHIWPGWRSAVPVIKPETVISWHRRGFRLFWTWKSQHRLGRPAVSHDVRALIREMSTANPLWGAPRIHGELLKLGIAVSQSTVGKYMRRHPRPPSQTWRTFLTNHASQIMAADFFVVPSVTFRLLFVLIILAHDRRRIVHVAVTEHPTAAWTAQQLRNAFSERDAPRYLLHDRDSVVADVATTIAGMNTQTVRTAPRSPWQNAYAERVIGSIRRECLDHVVVVNAAGLRRLLTAYIAYYMESRTHLALTKDPSISRPVMPASVGRIVVTPHVGGLHHRYDRAAA